MKRTIRVTGTGKIAVKPDLIRFVMESNETFSKYEDALSHSAAQTSILKEVLEEAGLDSKDLKTTTFNIDSDYESYLDKHGNHKKKLVGYEYYHRTYIEFDNDNLILGRLLYSLSKCPVNVEFDINYTIKNQEKVKNDLLTKCIKDSTEKAEVMAAAAGVKLADIVTIDYSWGELHINNRVVNEYAFNDNTELAPEAYSIDIEADDITLSDTVTIEWEILNQ